MKNILLLIFFLLNWLNPLLGQPSSTKEGVTDTTTIIFVRHAEKMDDGTDNPSLNEKGRERALRLAKLMKNEYQLSAVYSTDYNRTKETAGPVAETFDLELEYYGLNNPDRLVDGMLSEHAGETILVVGHSNTTPMLVNIAADTEEYEALDEKTYGKMFIVTLTEGFPPVVTEAEY